MITSTSHDVILEHVSHGVIHEHDVMQMGFYSFMDWFIGAAYTSPACRGETLIGLQIIERNLAGKHGYVKFYYDLY